MMMMMMMMMVVVVVVVVVVERGGKRKEETQREKRVSSWILTSRQPHKITSARQTLRQTGRDRKIQNSEFHYARIH